MPENHRWMLKCKILQLLQRSEIETEHANSQQLKQCFWSKKQNYVSGQGAFIGTGIYTSSDEKFNHQLWFLSPQMLADLLSSVSPMTAACRVICSVLVS